VHAVGDAVGGVAQVEVAAAEARPVAEGAAPAEDDRRGEAALVEDLEAGVAISVGVWIFTKAGPVVSRSTFTH